MAAKIQIIRGRFIVLKCMSDSHGRQAKGVGLDGRYHCEMPKFGVSPDSLGIHTDRVIVGS
jgi:hypothetical protein